LPSDLYTKGTFSALLELAQYYNGKPTESSPSVSLIKEGDHVSGGGLGGSEGGFAVTTTTKVFLFYRAYTK